MKNLCTKAALFIASLCAGNFLIRHFGNLYIDAITGYLRGNRRRVVSIIKLEWLMLHLDLIIYLHLFSFFTPPHVIWSFSGGRKSKSTTNYIKNLRFQCFCVYLISMFFAHLLYFLYIFENVEVPWMLYDISGIFNGIWLHLSAFSVFFVGINLVQDCLFARFEIFRKFVDEEIFRRFRALRLFCRVPQFQVLITLAVSFVFCLSHWYFCDKIFIRSMTLQLSEDSVNQTLRVVVLTDLHAGASVYRQQIENVVDATNSLQNVDAIFIIDYFKPVLVNTFN